jgi:hypothetical protein
MRTSVDRGTLRSQKRRWKQARRTSSIIVGLVVLCLMATGVIGCGEKSSEEGKLPEIVSFQANPPVNEGDPVSYTFEVNNATKIRLIEAGITIKEIAGPSSAIYEGAATGQASSAVLSSDNGTFDAVLEASNDYGTVKKTATLSGSSVLKATSGPLPPHSGWADLPCPTGCGCVTPQALPACGSGCSGPQQCQGPLASTPKYCYKIPVQPCDAASGCTCMEPNQALPGYVRCSDNKCAANPDKYCYKALPCTTCGFCLTPTQATPGSIKCSDNRCSITSEKYCYRQPCQEDLQCNRCLLDTVAAPCNWTPCTDTLPCNDPGEPAKSCYKCPSGCTCMTHAQAVSDNFDADNPCLDCKCSNPGEQDMYCYHKIPITYPACDITTGCVCRSDELFINAYCQGDMWPCSDNECGQGAHCYRCPSYCKCFQDGDPNRIPNGYTHRCNPNDKCTCLETSLETPEGDWHCYHKPGQ